MADPATRPDREDLEIFRVEGPTDSRKDDPHPSFLETEGGTLPAETFPYGPAHSRGTRSRQLQHTLRAPAAGGPGQARNPDPPTEQSRATATDPLRTVAALGYRVVVPPPRHGPAR
ncbi:hypothetical protein Ato02nite_045500 [Paractinoplanes toevensis]|uniref:Uncharacterized protein n=1 Tax=Paractinoplanes toevensis TaxID=571911 RepID=A0A919TCV2_9ACTN|nr:hypothetical protein Ato02nite_045500 [Actinoplanes toevensis]